MRDWHKPRIQALVEAGVDMLALETIPCQEEAEMLCDLLREFPGMKAWLAFSCKVRKTILHLLIYSIVSHTPLKHPKTRKF